MGSVTKVFKHIFSGGGSSPKVVYQPAQTEPQVAAAQAAPADATSLKEGDTTNTNLKKRKRGKASLYVTPESSSSYSGGTGLNL